MITDPIAGVIYPSEHPLPAKGQPKDNNPRKDDALRSNRSLSITRFRTNVRSAPKGEIKKPIIKPTDALKEKTPVIERKVEW